MLTPSTTRTRRGFTLIELIVVIVVLGVLAALVAFSYQTFLGDSRQATVRGTATQVGKAVASQSAKEQISSADAVADAPWQRDITDTAITVVPGAEAADGSVPVTVTNDGFCVVVTFSTATGHSGDVGTPAPEGTC